ncbi:OmpA family protein [Cesiribacter andamanensis]|uniref:OmpA family protein n=1 Tax=Cesiribacter andamanensis TaxID=649507 RepID=UPI00191C151D|nr:OmpA family protein [Cesiribacter andamanensis]
MYTPLLLAACLLLGTSCASLRDSLASKRYKQTVAERDGLLADKALLQADTARRGSQFRTLSTEHRQLQNRYSKLDQQFLNLNQDYQALMSSSTSKADQLNTALRQKQQELDRKEGLLKEREKALADMQLKMQRQDSVTNALNNLVKGALLGFKADELSVEQRNGKVYVSMSDKLLFQSGSAAVESKGQDALKKLGDVLAKHPDIDILVEGHTDNVPIKTALYKDNWDLSVARATSIVRLLSSTIAPTRITASGKGEYFPMAANDTAEGKARNRRTEIILSPKLDDLFKLIQKSSL